MHRVSWSATASQRADQPASQPVRAIRWAHPRRERGLDRRRKGRVCVCALCRRIYRSRQRRGLFQLIVIPLLVVPLRGGLSSATAIAAASCSCSCFCFCCCSSCSQTPRCCPQIPASPFSTVNYLPVYSTVRPQAPGETSSRERGTRGQRASIKDLSSSSTFSIVALGLVHRPCSPSPAPSSSSTKRGSRQAPPGPV